MNSAKQSSNGRSSQVPRLSQTAEAEFLSSKWLPSQSSETTETPAITPGRSAKLNDSDGKSGITKLTFGYHWCSNSYPAWTERKFRGDSGRDHKIEATSINISYTQEPGLIDNDIITGGPGIPFTTHFIAAKIDEVREAMGFQFDASVNVLELLMSQLDSRTSRSPPTAALRSLHGDYISGKHANYRQWYLACQMDTLDRACAKGSKIEGSHCQAGSMDLQEDISLVMEANNVSLTDAEADWDTSQRLLNNVDLLTDLIIYLFCWSEANQVRFMPECLAFIYKCARDYYLSQSGMHQREKGPRSQLTSTYFLENVITPIYECYYYFNFTQSSDGAWIRRDEDHKTLIGYDDMNQLFWYSDGIERLQIIEKADSEIQEFASNRRSIVNIEPEKRYTELKNIQWKEAFTKTYRESRSWLHNLTNFSRIWTLHISMFWFFTSFNAPTLYTKHYDYKNAKDPQVFVTLTVMSLGGLCGPVLTLIGLVGEWRFVPRQYSGARPVLPRILTVALMFAILLSTAICNLTFNSWEAEATELLPATVIAASLLGVAILYTFYFTVKPLKSVFCPNGLAFYSQTSEKLERRFLANAFFTANFARLEQHDAILSWSMCIMIFVAKFLESYFFLTLSLKDPLREMGIMATNNQCPQGLDTFGVIVCESYPFVILIGVIIADLVLFFLDTYLWYVIFNTILSVSFRSGTSIWSPWRNIYSRLSRRISTKLLAPVISTQTALERSVALQIVWNSIVNSMYHSHLLTRDQATRLTYLNATTQEPSFFTTEEDGMDLKRCPGMVNAHRRISFFAQSLSMPMPAPTTVYEMPTFTVLIPHYKEKIILGLQEIINSENDAKVTVLEYLQRLFPHEWSNFVENLKSANRQIDSVAAAAAKEIEASFPNDAFFSTVSSVAPRKSDTASHNLAISKLGFSSLNPIETDKTRIWCSERTQTLYRTVRGFSNYWEAIQVLHRAETPDVVSRSSEPTFSDTETDDSLSLCSRKFHMVIAMQLYMQFSCDQLCEVETLLSAFPGISICYVEHDPRTKSHYTCLFDRSCPILESGRRQPRLKIKLSGNPILGDGKSDNQNSAIPFYRGEYIQLVDANQDNYLEECLKIRNLLMEFEPSSDAYPVRPSCSLMSRIGAQELYETKLSDLEAQGDIKSCSTLERAPVAILGAREYIFSENFGVLGDVAAGKEQTFGTLFSRTLAKIGAKLHYGHPDFLNAIFMTTRGGVSKGQRGLHLNEDIYAGMNALLRGGRIKHSEYFQCGKGRELGFLSILNFTGKIGSGMGEQMLSREYFHLGTQLSFDRFVSFYYAHPGFHLNNILIVCSIELLLCLVLWISSIASVKTKCEYSKQEMNTCYTPSGCYNVLPLVEWIKGCIISIFVVFFVSLCPLFFQEMIEKGIMRSILRISRHFASLSMLFEVFVCRIYARSVLDDMNVGGAKYLATGRGLATSRLSFIKLYSGYYPEIIGGIRACFILWFGSHFLWNISYLWFWVTTFSLILCPVIYNPHQFDFNEFFNDYKVMLLWFTSATDQNMHQGMTSSWIGFNRRLRERITGVKQRSFASDVFKPALKNSLLFQIGTSCLTTLSIAVPFVFVKTQQKDAASHSAVQAILQVVYVASTPLIATSSLVAIGFTLSIIIHNCVKTNVFANAIATTIHILSMICILLSWSAIYILQDRNFYLSLLAAATVICLHYLLRITLTVLIVRRQRSPAKTNDPWWSGDWTSANVGWKLPLVMLEEYIIKCAIEPLEFTYDFLTCHLLLLIQAPFILLPGVDRLHTFFLMWLKPSITATSRRARTLQKRRSWFATAQWYCLLLVAIECFLLSLVICPLLLPERVISTVRETLVTWIPGS